jgi:hypothetical protein
LDVEFNYSANVLDTMPQRGTVRLFSGMQICLGARTKDALPLGVSLPLAANGRFVASMYKD